MPAKMVSFRLTAGEARELSLAARRRGMTVSDLCRESLYRVYGIGELHEVQPTQQSDTPQAAETPRADTPRVPRLRPRKPPRTQAWYGANGGGEDRERGARSSLR